MHSKASTAPLDGSQSPGPAGKQAIAAVGYFEKHRNVFLSAIATAIVMLPLWFIRFAPLHDYPFHVARMSILHDLVNGGGLSRYYEIGSFLLPNIGMDVIVVVLMQVLPVEAAASIFIALTTFIIIFGATYLHDSLHRSNNLTPFFAAILTYNSIFTLGFLNYLFGVGLALWCVGIFIRLRNRSAGLRLSVGVLAGVALLFAHLAAFGVYAVIIAGLELQACWPIVLQRLRATIVRLSLAALPLLLVAGIFFALSPTAGETSGPIRFGGATLFEVLRNKLWLVRQTFSGQDAQARCLGAVPRGDCD